jgi:hypothetical protein
MRAVVMPSMAVRVVPFLFHEQFHRAGLFEKAKITANAVTVVLSILAWLSRSGEHDFRIKVDRCTQRCRDQTTLFTFLKHTHRSFSIRTRGEQELD